MTDCISGKLFGQVTYGWIRDAGSASRIDEPRHIREDRLAGLDGMAALFGSSQGRRPIEAATRCRAASAAGKQRGRLPQATAIRGAALRIPGDPRQSGCPVKDLPTIPFHRNHPRPAPPAPRQRTQPPEAKLQSLISAKDNPMPDDECPETLGNAPICANLAKNLRDLVESPSDRPKLLTGAVKTLPIHEKLRKMNGFYPFLPLHPLRPRPIRETGAGGWKKEIYISWKRARGAADPPRLHDYQHALKIIARGAADQIRPTDIWNLKIIYN